MTDELAAVSCLNGEITVGDTVAVAVGEGRSGGGMRMGTVIGFKGGTLARVRVGVRVEHSSGYTGRHYEIIDGRYVSEYKAYDKWYDDPSRIVKVA